jgi:hypothetical protein
MFCSFLVAICAGSSETVQPAIFEAAEIKTPGYPARRWVEFLNVSVSPLSFGMSARVKHGCKVTSFVWCCFLSFKYMLSRDIVMALKETFQVRDLSMGLRRHLSAAVFLLCRTTTWQCE